jgi:iron complex outermembrane recepter protein
MKKNFLTLLLVIFTLSTYAQVVVSGKVVDADVQQALPGATITVKGKVDKGTVTDNNGKFSIRMDANADALEVSFIGYETIKVKLGAITQNLTISLVPSTEDLNEVQVIGFATERSLQETSASISLLTSKDLSKQNATSLAQSLNNLPGIRVDQSGLDNQRVTIRGIGANSNLGVRGIKVYFNDIPLTEPDGYTRMEALDFTTIGRVEIIRGPASSLYGTANGGVMNFNSERAVYGGTSLQVGQLFGSYGLNRTSSVFKHGSEKANIYASWTSQGSDGYRVNNRSDRDNVNFAGQFFLTNKFSINTVFARLHDNVRYPLAINYDQTKADPTQDAILVAATGKRSNIYNAGRDQTWTRWGINAKYEISDALKLSASYFGGKNDQISNSLTGPATTFTSLGTSEGVRAILSFKPKMDKFQIGINAGVEYQTFTQDGQNYSVTLSGDNVLGRNATPAASVLNGGANTLYFLQADVEITPKTILTVGSGFISYNYTRTDRLKANVTSNKDFNNQVAPRIALNQNFSDAFALRASLSKGFTPPILNEAVFSATSGDFIPTLDASTSQQIEFGARGSLLKKRLTYDIAYYNMKIDNELVTETRDFTPIARNAAETNRNGVEVSLSYDAIKAEDKQAISLLRYRASFTSQDFKYVNYKKETKYSVVLGATSVAYPRYGTADEPALEVSKNEPVLQANGQYINQDVTRGVLVENFSGNVIPGYAPIMFNLGVDVETSMGIYATVNYNFVDKTELFDGNKELSLRSASTGLRTLVAGTGTATVPAVLAPTVSRTYRNAYSIINLAIGYQKTFGNIGFKIYGNLDNVSDTQYSGFVRVNDNNGAYFNPSLPRNFSLGTNFTYNF